MKKVMLIVLAPMIFISCTSNQKNVEKVADSTFVVDSTAAVADTTKVDTTSNVISVAGNGGVVKPVK